MAADTTRMTPEENARLGVDIALFQEGLVKPFREHKILDPELYAKLQACGFHSSMSHATS